MADLFHTKDTNGARTPGLLRKGANSIKDQFRARLPKQPKKVGEATETLDSDHATRSKPTIAMPVDRLEGPHTNTATRSLFAGSSTAVRGVQDLAVSAIASINDLWGLAYQQLFKEKESLVTAYSHILSDATSISDTNGVQEQVQAVLALKREQILQKQWKLQWGNKSIRVRTQIDRIVKFIGVFKDIGSSIAGLDPVHAGLPWAGICFLISPILNDSDQNSTLLDGLDVITEIIARYMITSEIWLEEVNKMQDLIDLEPGFCRILLKLYTAILEYQFRAVCQLNRGTLLRMARNLPKFDDWTGLRSKITDLDTQCRLYHSMAASHSNLLSAQILKDFLARQEAQLDLLVTKQDDIQTVTREVTFSISEVMVGQDHEDVRDRLGSRYWNSGQWLLKLDAYETWKREHNGCLWLKGPVGVGKTCLTSIVIQQALSSAVSEQVAFFYCSQHKSETVDILRSILAQLSWDTNRDLVAPTKQWFEHSTGTRANSGEMFQRNHGPYMSRKISSTECIDLIMEIALSKGDQVIIIIDGLDECCDTYELLGHLGNLQNKLRNFRLFLSSRLSLHYVHRFLSPAIISHFGSSADIKNYIKAELDSHDRRSRSGMTTEQADMFQSLLIRRARGMFRWVQLQIDVILNKRYPILHPKDVQSKLDKLKFSNGHPTLNSIYNEIFTLNVQDEEHKRSLLVKTLRLVLCSFQPFKLKDIVQAIALDSDGTVDPAVDEDFVLQLSSNFLVVTKVGLVRFAHRSVKEYLMQSILPGGTRVELSSISAHVQAAVTCLTILLSLEQPKWETLPTDPLQEAYDLEFSGIEMYACFYWGPHCEKTKTLRMRNELGELFERFLLQKKGATQDTAFAKWNSLLWRAFNDGYYPEGLIRHRLETAFAIIPTPFFASCVWGFPEIIISLMAKNPSLIKEKNRQGKSGLFAACENGQFPTVHFLCSKGANVNERDSLWGTSVQAAAWAGNSRSFQTLVDAGAHMNAELGCYGRTIDAALRGGRQEVVRMALDAGAEVWTTSERTNKLSLATTFDGLPRPDQMDWLKRQWQIPHPKKFTVKTSYDFDYNSLKDKVKNNHSNRKIPGHVNKCGQSSELENVFHMGDKRLLHRLHMANIKRRQLYDCAKHAGAHSLIIRSKGRKAERIEPKLAIFPAPPVDGSHCSCCFRSFDSDFDVATQWRYHVIEDLRPYLCPFARCTNGCKLFSGFREWKTHVANKDEEHHTWYTGIESFPRQCPICGEDLWWLKLPPAYNSGEDALLSHVAHHMEEIALLAIPWEQSDRESFKGTDASANHTLSSKSDRVSVSGWSSMSSLEKAGSIPGSDHMSVGTGSSQLIARRQSGRLSSDDSNEDLLKRGRFGEEYGDLINRAGPTRSNGRWGAIESSSSSSSDVYSSLFERLGGADD